MKKFTFYDSKKNQLRKTKRWLGMLSFLMLLFIGQTGFAFSANADDDEVSSCNQVSQSTATGTSWAFGGETNQTLAADFVIYEGTTFEIQEIKINVTGTPTYFNITILEDNDGLPGTVLYTFTDVTMTGSESVYAGITQHTLDISSESLSLSSAIGDTRYWLQVETNATGWENRVGSQLGVQDVYLHDNTAGWTTINVDTGNNDLVYELIGECIGCVPPSALAASPDGLTDVTLSWVSEGSLFEVEWGLSGFTLGNGTLINDITANSTDITVLAQTPYQFYIRQDCGADQSSWAGPFNFQTGYCIPSSTNTSDVISSFVTTGGILNIGNNTGTTISPGGYGDFTALSVAHLETGMINFTANFNIGMGFNIWVDWNDNGTFEESEKVYTSGATGNSFIGSFTIPADTELGDYRMRIRAQWNNANPAPCGSITYGEAEDYTLTVIDPPSCFPPSGLGAGMIDFTTAELYWTSDGDNFEVEYGLSGFVLGEGTVVGGDIINASVVIENLASDVFYQFYVRQDCGDDDISFWAGPYQFYTGYCSVSTQWPGQWENISSFVTTGGITNIDNETGNVVSEGGYGNFTALSISHFETGEVSFTIGTNGWMGVNMWIDWNNNMIFEEDEKVFATGGTSNGPYTGMFMIPEDTPLGNYRIRIRGANGIADPSPCGQINYGETEDYTLTVIEVPTCMPPNQLGANIVTLTSVELLWNSEGGTDFEIEYGLQNFGLGNGVTVSDIEATSVVLENLEPNTYYHFYVRRDCSQGDLSPWAGPYTFYTNYCEASTQWPSQWETITSFVTTTGIINIHNETGNAFSEDGYGDFTFLSVSHFEAGEINFTIGTNGWMGVNIWVDWNNNMVFEESEKVFASGFTGNGPYTGMFAIPEDTPLGDYMLRVRGVDGIANPSPCGQINYGETEDYTLTVIEVPTCMPPGQLGANIINLTSAELFWNSSEGTDFEIEYGVQNFSLGSGAMISGIETTSVTLENLTPNTYYQFYVRRDCGNNDLSPWTGPYIFYTNYCAVSSNWEWDYISSFVTTGGIINISNETLGISAGGYGDFTAMSASHFESGEVSFTLTTNNYFGVNIWIDWNNNMVFEEDEKVYASSSMGNGPFTGMFSVPMGTPIGDYRMRVRGSNGIANPPPCGAIDYGETEDYTFTVIAVPTCMPPNQLGANIITLTSAELLWNSADGTDFEIEYGVQNFGLGNGTTVSGIETTSITLENLTPNTYHHFYVRRDCGQGDLSPWVGPYTFYTNYCVASTQWPGQWENIASFTTTAGINNIDNETGTTISEGGYGNFTNLSVSHFETGEVSFTIETNGWMGVNMWIDWNNNMVFEEDEKVLASGLVGEGPYTGMFMIPEGTPLGDYRIRIRGANNIANPSPCGLINYGETEDYTLTVIEVPTCMPPNQLGANILTLTSAEIFWNSLEGTDFEIEYGLQNFGLGNGITVSGIETTSITLDNLAPNTYHHFYVRRDCGQGDLSPWIGPYTFYTNYCVASATYMGDHITSFTTTGGIPFDISNSSGDAITSSGYSNYADQSVHHFETGEITFTATTGSNYCGLSIWVDWNNNMVFDEDEKVYTSSGGTTGTFSGTILVPLGTPVGEYRIRVRSQYDGPPTSACGNVTWGEAEDYTITVITPPDCLPAFKPTATNISASSVLLEWEADGDVFDIEYGLEGFEPGGQGATLIEEVGNPFILSGLTSGETYQYYVRQDCGEEDGVSTWNGPVTFTPGFYQGSIPTMLNPNPSVDDLSCAMPSFSIEVPEGHYLSELSVEYSMISIPMNMAQVAHQRSVLYSPTLEMGEANIAVGDPEYTYPGTQEYSRNITFALGATGTIEFILKAWRTEGGTGCNLDYTFVLDDTWVLHYDFEAFPTCPIPTDLGYTNITETSVDLIWTSEAEGVYDLEWGTIGFTPAEDEAEGTFYGVEGTVQPITGLDASDTYEFYVRSNCSTEDEEDVSQWAGPFKFKSGYCEPISQQSRYITLFSTTGAEENITYTSATLPEGSVFGYRDYTDMVIVQQAGESFDFQSNYIGGPSGARIWVDWNKNFVFEDDEEVFYHGGAPLKSGTIEIPEDVLPGDYVLRVYYKSGASSVPTACEDVVEGEAIDFTLSIPCSEVALPIGETVQTFTEGQTLANLVVTGSGLVWYADADLTEVLEPTHELVHDTTYYVVSSIGDCQSEALVIVVEEVVSRVDFNRYEFKYYPNPVSQILYLSSNTTISDVVVLNMLGQQLNLPMQPNNSHIDMTELPAGNYFISVTIEGINKVFKVVKQ